jgi:dCTP deaminase
MSGHLLVDHQLRGLLGQAVRPSPGGAPMLPEQVQASSLDLRLGATAHRIRAGFLPGSTGIEDRLGELETSRLSLAGEGAVLEKGLVYLIPLQAELDLPADLSAAFNPRSSAGRCDLFTRVLVPGHPRFNEAPAGYRGPLWIEVAPLSFPVRLAMGDRLSQLRLARGNPALTPAELRAEYERTPLVHDARGPVPLEEVRFDDEGGLALHLGLAGREPAGWRARTETGVLHFAAEGAHEMHEFWNEVRAPGGHCILPPGGFHLFASRERVSIPPHLAAEMLPIDTDLGELRNNYAGFFDNGFGWERGTPAVLEVRAHDVPFLVEDGQVFFRLRFYRTDGAPERLYAEGRSGGSYRDQDLTPARCFRSN